MVGVTKDLYETIERTVRGLGYELVDVERLTAGLLRVTLDRASDSPGDGEHRSAIGLEDCERVSKHLSHLFAVEDVDYQRLEVSSPGLDRPLKRLRDFEKNVGAEIQLQLFAPLMFESGVRRRLRGKLLEVTGDAGKERLRIALSAEDSAGGAGKRAGRRQRKSAEKPAEVIEVQLAEIEKAKLIPALNFRAGQSGSRE